MLETSARAHVSRARSVIDEARQILTEGFARLGYAVTPSQANFVLVEVGEGAAFRRALLPHGLVVRDAASFGLRHHVRVACRLPEDCLRLLEAVATLRGADPVSP
jgi:histidinol-phosphate/aromatic aminotransferase/cobyric acid decarboxylase-like protein